MRLDWGSYGKWHAEPFDMVGLCFDCHIYEPYYFSTLHNDDLSYKQAGHYRGLKILVYFWRTTYYIDFAYKRVELPKKFPKPGLATKLAQHRMKQ